ncbi:MAG: hypothetical protein M3O15_14910, partial [Acidobacteriota bacterium]|nr:hypothetical protein [Acidobacteriota bacterium]
MRGFVTVFNREIAERRLIVAGAALLSLVPLLTPLLPGQDVHRTSDMRWGTALVLGSVVATVLALVLGGTAIAADLAARRLGFYFSRPLSGWTIWSGKLGAAAVLAYGAGLLVLLPTLLFEGFPSSRTLAGLAGPAGQLALAVLSLTLGPLLLAHAVSVIVRSRSAWFLLDLVALAAVAGTAWTAWERLMHQGAGRTLENTYGGFLLLPVLALATASAVQVLVGRTDLHRAHRLL